MGKQGFVGSQSHLVGSRGRNQRRSGVLGESMSTRSRTTKRPGRAQTATRHTLVLVLGTLALTGLEQAVPASGAPARGRATPTESLRGLSRAATIPTGASAALEACVTASEQSGRSATFSGQMITVIGAERMAIRVELEERTHASGGFRAVLAPGLGVWRTSEPGVKIYKYIKEVTNLSAPAAYRGLVHFRWTNAKGRLVRASTLRTQVCKEPLLPPPSTSTSTTTTTTKAG